ncbi:hypothetical protein CAL7716_058400 [Calothrix sp. PCC 7716]|nr:hypothetical protein CAL7716_058400 [Calothrix sp. PCC 7716]
MKLSSQQRKKLQEALIDAFPNVSSLKQMLSHELDENLEVITGEGKNLQDIIFTLIQTANSQGWVEGLVCAARKYNPGNVLLETTVEELLTYPKKTHVCFKEKKQTKLFPISSQTLSNPFVAAGMIQESWLFVARSSELQALVSRMTGAQPTSVNVVGAKRIGKSSLLYHFYLTWEQRVLDPSRYTVIYLSLQSVQCQCENNFYKTIAQELLTRPSILAKQSICDILTKETIDRMLFTLIMTECKKQNILPVICLDDFKQLFNHKNEFDDRFYDNLRSLMDNNVLMLIVATDKELDLYRNKHGLTSSFFNLGHILRLKLFNEEEVKDLLSLPASTIPNYSPTLGIRDQELVKELGGNHPFLLQLAANLVCEARQHKYDEIWIRKQFKFQRNRLPYSTNIKQDYKHPLRSIRYFFSTVGASSFWLVELWNNRKDVVFGAIFVTLIIYCLRNPSKIQKFLENLLN